MMLQVEDSHIIALNRSYWDAVSWAHTDGENSYYDTSALLAGEDTLFPHQNAAMGDVEGLDVLDVQCHIGFNCISLARRGARVTGVDISPTALNTGRTLAEQCDVPVTFVEADSSSLPDSLYGRFDLAHAHLGVIYWAPDPGMWMRSVAACLRPGGRLVLFEYHPVISMLESLDPPAAAWSYDDSGPHFLTRHGTYAAADAQLSSAQMVTYHHTLGTVLTAAVDAGLLVRSVTEHTKIEAPRTGTVAVKEPDGKLRARLGAHPLPVMYTLIADRPGD
ncbi:class I SAM-dependent methyltransferase [Streptomyces sp. NPDC053499]|uniref:class I SAM-dependent methyltransferase n=1 Tax=Streptomyces sp. NPDC053499 TaxID=3365707 RepID=UPI0037D18170